MQMTFRWRVSPSRLIRETERYGQRVMVAVRAVASYFSTLVQNEMRQHAIWQDRTGNARSGLFSAVDDAAADLVTIYLSHGFTVDYGKYLELSRGGRYAIIMPTIQRNIPVLQKLLDGIFR